VRESLDPRSPVNIDPRPTIYRPLSQEPVTGMTLFVRTHPDPLTLARLVRGEVAAVDRTIPVMMLQSVREGLMDSMATPRFNATLLAAFAALALLLAAVGVFGVIAYSVNQRTHEIGIRVALGASPSRILRGVVGEALTLAVFGVAAGVAGAFGAARVIASQLYGTQPTDPLAVAAMTFALIVVALTASAAPARRASRLDPLVALRHE
jgi:putative ABC transport system permease protein